MLALHKVISGGQTGVDQAALRAARDCGLEIGGWCPPGRECETGVIPAEFPLKETREERSAGAPQVPRSQRTEWNVRDSDATLIVVTSNASHSDAATVESGTRWTMKCADCYKRPLLVCDLKDGDAREKIRQWLETGQFRTLNVAGPGEGASPGIGERAYALLRKVFDDL